MTDFSIAAESAAALQPDLTPAAIQPLRLLHRRRLFFALAVSGTLLALGCGLFIGLGLDGRRWPFFETLIFLLASLGLPWLVNGFWNAVIGLWLLRGRRGGFAEAAPFWRSGAAARPLAIRVAVLMTVRNEDPARAFSRLMAVRESLDETGEGAAFDYFFLSDTSKAPIAAEEEALCATWRARFGADARLTYRRRERNEGFKAGNIRDFLERWGDDYEAMLTLDADSVMSGRAVLRLVRIMQRFPRLGILQSLVVGAPAASAFARVFQFGMRHSMRPYTVGSAWWTGDCGPYWGHNALIRVKPFKEFCQLPRLPGKPPLGGHVLSHDQIEAALMRRAGYEVRVAPVEGGSYEDSPPTLLDFAGRDLRWCQGNMQYLRLLGLPGLKLVSRVQIALAILMYFGAAAWGGVIAAASVAAMTGGLRGFDGAIAGAVLAVLFIMYITPKLAGVADVILARNGPAQYGGLGRLLAGAALELVFSMLLAPIVTLRSALFMFGLLAGRAVTWNGQARDAHRLSWRAAARALWPQTAAGAAFFAVLLAYPSAPLLWASPLMAGLVLSIPLAVVSASARVGEAMAAVMLCAIPEEFDDAVILQSFRATAIPARTAADLPAEAL